MPYFKTLIGASLVGLAWIVSGLPLPNRDFAVQSNGDDLFDGRGGVDTISYEAEDMPILLSLVQWTAMGEHVGTDTLANLENVRGGKAGDLLIGDDGVNVLDGMAGNDELWGLGGDDILAGGTGADLLVGTNGDDRYIHAVGDGSDQIVEGATEGENDVLAIDTSDMGLLGAVQLSRFADNLRITINSASGIETIVVWDQFEPSGLAGIETLIVDRSQPLLLEVATVVDEPWYACMLPFVGDCPPRPDINSPPVIDRETMTVSHR